MATVEELQEKIEALETARQEARLLRQSSQRLNEVEDENELLAVLATLPDLEPLPTWAALYRIIDLDETKNPAWGEVTTVWSPDSAAPLPPGMRFFLPQFPFSAPWAKQPNAPLFVESALEDDRIDEASQRTMVQSKSRAMVVIPLIQAGHWIGFVSLNWDQPRPFGPLDRAIYEAFTSLASPVAETRYLLSQEKETMVQTLFNISNQLNASADEEELLHVLTHPSQEAGATLSLLAYIDLDEAGEPEWAEIVSTWQDEGTRVTADLIAAIWSSIIATCQDEGRAPQSTGAHYHLAEFPFTPLWLIHQAEPQLVANVATDHRLTPDIKKILAEVGMQAVAIVPLAVKGRWMGTISMFWEESHPFNETEFAIYRALTSLASPTIATRRRIRNLTDRAEQQTTEAGRFRTLAENATEAIAMTDLSGAYVYANQAYHQLLGYNEESASLVNRSLAQLLPETVDTPADAELSPKAVDALQTLLDGWRGEREVARRDSTRFQAELTTFALTGPAGKPLNLAVMLHDLTHSKQIEAWPTLQRDLLQSLTAAGTQTEALAQCLATAVQSARLERGRLYLPDEDGALNLVAQQGLSPEAVPALQTLEADAPATQSLHPQEAVFANQAHLGANPTLQAGDPELTAVAIIPVYHQDDLQAVMHLGSTGLNQVPEFAPIPLETIAIHIAALLERDQAATVLKQSHGQAEAKLEQLRTESEIALQSLRTRTNNDLQQIKSQTETALKENDSKRQAELTAIRSAGQAALQQITRSATAQIQTTQIESETTLQAVSTQAETTLHEIQTALKNQQQTAQTQARTELEETRAQAEAALQTLQQAKAQTESELVQTRAQAEAALQTLQQTKAQTEADLAQTRAQAQVNLQAAETLAATQLQDTRTQADSTLQAAATRAETNLQEMQRVLQSNLQTLQSQSQTELEQTRSEAEIALASLKKQAQVQLETTQTETERGLQATRTATETRLETLQSETGSALEAIQTHSSTELEETRAQAEAALQTLQQAKAQTEADLAQTRAQAQVNLQAAETLAATQLQDTRTQADSTLQAAATRAETNLQEMQRALQSNLQTLQSQSQTELEQTRSEAEIALASLKKQAQVQLETTQTETERGLQATRTATETRLETLQSETGSALEAIQTHSSTELEETRAQAEAALQTLQQAKAQTEADLAQTRRNATASLAAAKNQAAAQLHDMQTQAETNLHAARTASETQLKTLQSETGSALEAIQTHSSTELEETRAQAEAALRALQQAKAQTEADLAQTRRNATASLAAAKNQAAAQLHDMQTQAETNLHAARTASETQLKTLQSETGSALEAIQTHSSTELEETRAQAQAALQTLQQAKAQTEADLTQTRLAAVSSLAAAQTQAAAQLQTMQAQAAAELQTARDAARHELHELQTHAEAQIQTINQQADGSLTQTKNRSLTALQNLRQLLETELQETHSQAETALLDANTKAEAKLQTVLAQSAAAMETLKSETQAELRAVKSEAEARVQAANTRANQKIQEIQSQSEAALQDTQTKAQAELLETQAELKHRQKQHAQLQQAVSDWIWQVDTEGNVTDSNQVVANFLGYQPDELTGQPIFGLIHPDQQNSVQSSFVQAMVGQTVEKQAGWSDIIISWRHRDGSTRRSRSWLHPLFDRRGYLSGFQGIEQNITQLTQFEAERNALFTHMRAMADLAEAANAAQEFDGLIKSTVTLLQSRLDLYLSQIYIFDQAARELDMRVCAGEAAELLQMEGHRVSLENERSLLTQAVHRRKIVLTNDVSREPNYTPHPLLPDTRAQAVAPLISGNQLVGLLDLHSDRPNRFSQDDLDFLNVVSGYLSTAFARLVLHQRFQQKQKEAEQEQTAHQQQLIEVQEQAIQSLPTPIIPMMGQIVAIPLIGKIDSVRSQNINRAVRDGIREHRAKIVILDVSGVPIDSETTKHVNHIIQTAKQQGAQITVSGIPDSLTDSIVS